MYIYIILFYIIILLSFCKIIILLFNDYVILLYIIYIGPRGGEWEHPGGGVRAGLVWERKEWEEMDNF